MKVFSEEPYPQGSLQWSLLRSGIVTASEMDSLVTPKFKIKTGDAVDSYLAAKTAEFWQSGPLPSKPVWDMEQGAILEAEARDWFSFTYDTGITKVGFITTDDGNVGCSPDGLLPNDCGIEIKCPLAQTHTGYLLDGILPEKYEHQIHASMFVTGFNHWKFFSHRRGFPGFVLTVARDEKKIAVIAEALALFREKFEVAMRRMEEINGGPRRRLTPITPKAHVKPLIDQIESLRPKADKSIDLTYLQ